MKAEADMPTGGRAAVVVNPRGGVAGRRAVGQAGNARQPVNRGSVGDAGRGSIGHTRSLARERCDSMTQAFDRVSHDFAQRIGFRILF